MCGVIESEARPLVEAVRRAAREHGTAWAELVPTPHAINPEAEAGEEAAYATMAEAKRRLRAHILATYGLAPAELASLAAV